MLSQSPHIPPEHSHRFGDESGLKSDQSKSFHGEFENLSWGKRHAFSASACAPGAAGPLCDKACPHWRGWSHSAASEHLVSRAEDPGAALGPPLPKPGYRVFFSLIYATPSPIPPCTCTVGQRLLIPFNRSEVQTQSNSDSDGNSYYVYF